MQVLHLPEHLEISFHSSVRVLPGGGWLLNTYNRSISKYDRPIVVRSGQPLFFHEHAGMIITASELGQDNKLRYKPYKGKCIYLDDCGMPCSKSEAIGERDTSKYLVNELYATEGQWPVVCPVHYSQGNILRIALGIAKGGIIIVRKADNACQVLEIVGGVGGATLSADNFTVFCFKGNTIYIVDNELT